MSALATPQQAEAQALVAAVPDPELPFLTIADLGILRDVRVDGTAVHVQITPTYSGCPALDAIRDDVTKALTDHGFTAVTVETVLTPAWTTDWLSAAAREALEEHGIAPPGKVVGPVPVSLGRGGPGAPTLPREGAHDRGQVPMIVGDSRSGTPRLRCPRCGSLDAEELARFGSTACKALWRCRSCREPFEQFKAY